MGEPKRQYQPIDLLEFKRRLLARSESSANTTEDPLSELARIIGGDGRIVSDEVDFRDEASAGRRTPAVLRSAEPPKTDLEPVERRLFSLEEPSPEYGAVDPPFGDYAGADESTHDEWQDHANDASYSSEGFLVAPAEDAHLRLHDRRHANLSLYVTAAAFVIAGAMAVYFLRLGRPVLSPAEYSAGAPAVAKVRPVAANSLPAKAQNTSAVASAQATTDGGAQLPGSPLPSPTNDAAVLGTPVAALPNSSLPPQGDSLFMHPRLVRTIPVYSTGNFSEPASMAPSGNQTAPVAGLTLGRVVEAQPLQTTPPAAQSPSAGDNADPARVPTQNVASAEPPPSPVRPTVKPAPTKTATGATYAAILASPATVSDARGLLTQLERKYGAMFGGHRLTYHRFKGAGGTIYKVRVAGLSDDVAQTLCAKLTSAGASCKVEAQ